MSAPGVSYAFAKRPKWIVWHVIAVVAVVAMVNAGFWQLRRLDQRRQENATIAARAEVPPVPVQEVVALGTAPAAIDELEFRTVTAVGEYRVADQVIVQNRTNGGAPGYWVLTPLVLDDGDAFVVNRGWIPLANGEAEAVAYAPPAGRVTVTARLLPTQVREGIGIADPAEGRLAKLSRVDVPRLAQQVAYPVLPAYGDVISSVPPAPGAIPSPIPPRPLDDGNHLNYAGQWFIFSALTIVTYPALLRRTARRRAEPDVHDEPSPRPANASA